MASRKRNEWLEAEESDEEDQGYNSEDESKSHLLRTSKRQKVSHSSDAEDDQQDAQSDIDDLREEPAEPDQDDDNEEDEDQANDIAAVKPTSRKPLALVAKPKKDKSGIIYLSRCPPFMKPSVLRSLLTPYGPVGRIFLTPEPQTQRSKRVKSGGTRRKLFLDGWVEFTHKRDAKFVAEALNAQTIGGKKRSRWHDEVWNIKYLSGVKWNDLVEQIQNENAERQARMRAEISQTTKENKRFLEDVERGRIGKTMEERAKKRKKFGDDSEDVGEDNDREERPQKGVKREFRQNEIKTKSDRKAEPGQDVGKVLSMMF